MKEKHVSEPEHSDRDGGFEGNVEEPPPRAPLPSLLNDGGLVGQSQAMRALGDLLTRVATLDATVLIQGESGTGKELVARVLHLRSPRALGPFIAVNCAALTEALLESELFGHVRGAFTGANTDKLGLFEAASKGTLFLDEIGEIPAGMQAKLLRVLQEHAIRPVGSSTQEKPIDVRIVVATNRDLQNEVQAGRFREDLYYRINVFTIEVPPLRERKDDVIVLANHFLEEMAIRFQKNTSRISDETLEILLGHTWPGNVRELSNCIERAVALARTNVIETTDLPPSLLSIRKREETTSPEPSTPEPSTKKRGFFSDKLITLGELEMNYIQHVLDAVSGNKTEAAHILGIDRRTLHRKLGRMETDDDDDA